MAKWRNAGGAAFGRMVPRWTFGPLNNMSGSKIARQQAARRIKNMFRQKLFRKKLSALARRARQRRAVAGLGRYFLRRRIAEYV